MPLTEHDLMLISSFIDGQLTDSERAALEARLAADIGLKAELESLRGTVSLLRLAERVKVPRSFTLDPKAYGRPLLPSWWEHLGLGLSPLASAGAAIAVALICGGGFLLTTSFAGLGTAANRAPALSVAEQQDAAKMAPAATEAATEAPALTQAPMMAAAVPSEAGTPTSDGVSLLNPAPTANAGASAGVGGGAGGIQPPYGYAPLAPQPTSQPQTGGVRAASTSPYGSESATANAASDQVTQEGATAPQVGDQPAPAGAPTTQAAAPVEAAPVNNSALPASSPLLPILGGAAVLAGLVILAAIFLRRGA